MECFMKKIRIVEVSQALMYAVSTCILCPRAVRGHSQKGWKTDVMAQNGNFDIISQLIG